MPRLTKRLTPSWAALVLLALAACTPQEAQQGIPDSIRAPALSTSVTPTEGRAPVYDFARYPDDVWRYHLTLTRKAASSCGYQPITYPGYQGCIFSTLDGYVRAEENPALTDLHEHLPLNFRYRPDRPDRPIALLPQPFKMS